MLARAFRADLLKMKGKGLWFLVLLAPLGLIAMQALNYGLRYDYLMQQYADDQWGNLFHNLMGFIPIALLLGVTILGSMTASIEHQLSSWKQLLALPISRYSVYASKFMVVVLMLTMACILLMFGTVVLGLGLGFEASIPVAKLLKMSFFPFIAAWPLLAFVLWLCLTFKNQSMPITIGVVCAVLAFSPVDERLPISWPYAAYQSANSLLFLGAGLVCGVIVFAIGSIHFNKKDVS
ncbi:ABC transporter permease [Paenibacillus sp. N1-5-1-14]|uniref:ABC transporter permease n=1 Tax=Paenibacillus radicibacter TaxID=2972488 RepID=UPI0021599857|nr:ABC transporter permease [Paenibacillus radicibacter]MCR8645131.1 ABC transporter permease [Paenibacillus radicibacter]